MNLKLLLTALGLIVFTNILLLVGITVMNFSYMLSMLGGIFTILLLWFLFLKKEIPIGLEPLRKKNIFVVIPIVLITLILIVLMLSVNTSIYRDALISMFITALLVGIYEEIVFRAITLSSILKSGFSPGASIFISALIFSFFHINFVSSMGVETIYLLFNTFMMGVFLGLVYFQTKNILFLIALHTLWDFTIFINQALPLDKLSSTATLILFATTVLYFSWSIKKIKAMKQTLYKEK